MFQGLRRRACSRVSEFRVCPTRRVTPSRMNLASGTPEPAGVVGYIMYIYIYDSTQSLCNNKAVRSQSQYSYCPPTPSPNYSIRGRPLHFPRKPHRLMQMLGSPCCGTRAKYVKSSFYGLAISPRRTRKKKKKAT